MYRSVIAPILKLSRENPIIQLFMGGYFSSIILGWLILQLPLCQNTFVSRLDCLFTAASAISTTGLATVDIGKTFSFQGQLVLLLLTQLGGIAYMVFSSFVILSLEKRMLDFHRKIPSLPISLSRGHTMKGLIKQVIAYVLACEIIGLMLLYLFFRDAGVESALWNATFHSISAFCTAGFSLFSSNLENFKNHLGINVTLSILSLFGALGFFLWTDFIKTITSQKRRIRWAARITESFAATAILVAVFLFILMTTFRVEYSGFLRLLISFFQVVSTITTAGFNTIDIKALSQGTLLFLMLLMLFGASLTGSGTNMKGTSFKSLLKLMINVTYRKRAACLWGQKILLKRVQLASSTFIHYALVLSITSLLLILIEKHPFLPILFETASALCTVGLSMGITAELSALGKSLIILLMLIGRSGILVVGFAMSNKELSMEREIPKKIVDVS